jgi:ribosomal protein L7/L12
MVDSGILLLGAVILVGVAMLGSSAVDRKLSRVERRIVQLDRKLDAVLDHLGIVGSEPELDQVNALLRQGKKIQAIKVYRESTGADLKEAKDAVDRLAGQA